MIRTTVSFTGGHLWTPLVNLENSPRQSRDCSSALSICVPRRCCGARGEGLKCCLTRGCLCQEWGAAQRAQDEAERREEQTGAPRWPLQALSWTEERPDRLQTRSSLACRLWIQLPPDRGRCCYAWLSPRAGPGW